LPFSPQADRIVLKAGDEVLTERDRSNSPPALDLLAPARGEVWQELGDIRWEASDHDEDLITYTVLYSNNSGETWKTLAANLPQANLQVDATALAGSDLGQALVRVYASDGFNSTMAESAPFTVAQKSPHVRILAPKEDAEFLQGQLVNLIGGAIDPEDDTLGDEAYSWHSQPYPCSIRCVPGILGQGQELRLRNISPGRHTIFLRVRDSDNNISTDSILIQVSEQPNAQPVADAGLDRTVPVGKVVELNGEGSFDPNGDTLDFDWRFIDAPAQILGPPLLQDSNTATPTFVPLVPGTYVVGLVARDGQVNSFLSRVVIQVIEGVCGDQNGDETVNILDAFIDLQIAVGRVKPTEQQLVLSDLDQNSSIDIRDAIETLRHLVGLTDITRCGPVFFDDFESISLPGWVGKDGGAHHGLVVDDPLRPGNKVLTFRALSSSGDIFSPEVRVAPGQPYVLSFDYLGIYDPASSAEEENLGGFIGFSESTPGEHRWLAGFTIAGHSAFVLIPEVIGHDQFADLNLRTSVGPLVGYQWFESKEINLRTSTGISYVKEDFINQPNDDYVALPWSIDFDKYLFGDFMQFYHKQTGFWNLEDTGDVNLDTWTGLRFPLVLGLVATTEIKVEYDSGAAEGADEVDTTYSLKLGYQW